MKRILILIICTAGLFCSCSSDFLDLKPALSLSSNNYYQSEEDYLTTLNSVYQGYKNVLASYYIMAELRSDNTTNQFDYVNRGADIMTREQIDEFTMNEMNTSNGYWASGFFIIYRANTLLKLLENAPANLFKTPKLRERIEAECRFARAFHYFNLVRFYGDVPLLEKPIESTAESFAIPRSPIASIYELINRDLDFCIKNLPVSYQDVNDNGRITQGAALTMLAKVQMTNKDFSSAVNTLKKITTMGYRLQENYNDCFRPDNKNNSESIFEIQYSIESSGSNTLIFNWLPRGADAWEYVLHYKGGLIFQWNTPTKDMLNAYEPEDKRKEISVALGYLDKDGVFNAVPYINKWIVYSTMEVNQNACNMPIYRYADVLLMLAESLNEIAYEPGGEAFSLLNAVRVRGGLPELTSDKVPDQASFRLAIERERRVELAFEGHRWFDLLRTNRAIDVIRAFGVIEKADPSTYRPPTEPFPANAFDIQPYMLLYPVPYSERIKNPNVIIQNPGY